MSRISATPPLVFLRLSIASDVAEIPMVAKSLRQFLSQKGCAESDLMDCELALVEACNNAIEYAPDARTSGIGIEASCSPQEIELRIVDHTPGFDWPKQAELPKPESERGRGIFLIQAAMTNSRYERGPTGNTLVLNKTRSPH